MAVGICYADELSTLNLFSYPRQIDVIRAFAPSTIPTLASFLTLVAIADEPQLATKLPNENEVGSLCRLGTARSDGSVFPFRKRTSVGPIGLGPCW